MTDHQSPPPADTAPDPAPPGLGEQEIGRLAESFSGLQYVVVHAQFQWPWTSARATNQVVDLVRSIPGLLADLARTRAEAAALREALVWIGHFDRAALDVARTLHYDMAERARATLAAPSPEDEHGDG